MRNSNPPAQTTRCFYGIPGLGFVWRGAWNDPLVAHNGLYYNYYDLEDCMWALYKEEPRTVAFEDFVLQNAGVVFELLKNIAGRPLA